MNEKIIKVFRESSQITEFEKDIMRQQLSQFETQIMNTMSIEDDNRTFTSDFVSKMRALVYNYLVETLEKDKKYNFKFCSEFSKESSR